MMSERHHEILQSGGMIPHLVLVFDILTILPGIEIEGPVTESTLH